MVKSGYSLSALAQEVERSLDEAEGRGLYLDGPITIRDRKHLERELEAEEKKGMPGPSIKKLLSNDSDQWFAFFHVHT